jgi:hypothetical protein
MRTIEYLARRWSPKRYCRWMLARARREREKKLKAARSLPASERANLADQLDHDIFELEQWLTEMEDEELVGRARSMDVYLDDIPIPKPQDEQDEQLRSRGLNPHYYMGSYWNELLHPDCRAALTKAIRERYPAYRKERREKWDIGIRVAAALTGLIGAATGLVALLKK